MPRKRNSIVINYNEKELYRIFKDLERYGRTSYSYPEKQNSISRTISKKGTHLIHGKFLYPPISAYRSHQIKETRSFIQLPINVKIVEKKGRKKSIFNFKMHNIL